MKEVCPEECKKLLLNILTNVASFCDEHGIRYSLAYGTLIGAIRHKGFIPWDDDIDIIMMRDEYERFVSAYNDDKYVLIRGEDMSNHLHVVVTDMSTVLSFINQPGHSHFYHGGLWVDIFPIDNVPDDKHTFRFITKSLLGIKRMHRLSQFTNRKEFYIKLLHFMLKPFEGLLNKLMFGIVGLCSEKRTNTVGSLALCYLSYPSFPARLMDEFVEVEFEGHRFKSIKGYDEFLRGVYGDYMKLPPAEQRVPRHSYTAYYRE